MNSASYVGVFVVTCVTANLILGAVVGGRWPTAIVLAISSTVSVLAFQLFAYRNLGYLDPFFHIAALIQALMALVIGAATLWFIHQLKRRVGQGH